MTIKLFIDTGAFVAYHNKDDKNHKKAAEIFKDIAKDKLYTKLFTSDYIIDEAVTTCRVRTKRHDLSVLLGETILNSESISTIKINEYIFSAAWELYKKYKDVDLSFTNCSIVIIMNLYDINQIFSFDEHFDVFKFSRIS